MTELSFLLELLLEYKLQKTVQLRIKDRIKELEEKPQTAPRMAIPQHVPPALAMQSPSTIANMTKEEVAQAPGAIVTPAAAAAMQARQDSLRIATSGVEEKGRTSPRKF